MGRTRRRRLLLKRNGTSNPDKHPNIIDLKTWMYNHKWKNKSLLKLGVFENTGRGLTSLKDIENLDVLIEVPYELMITYTTLENAQSIKPILLNNCEKLTMQDLLTIFLVLERHKGDQSSWKAYVSSLPIINPPLTWLCSFEEIERIFDSDLKTQAKISLEAFTLSWQRFLKSANLEWVCECCGNCTTCVFTINSFTWAYVMVNSRSVYVDPDLVRRLTVSADFLNGVLSDQPCMALCPYLDMFNHSCHVKTRAELENTNGEWTYKLITSTSFKKYHELFISYGEHDNLKLLCEYGFFIPDECLEKVKFKLEEVVGACKFFPSLRQINFLKEKCLERDLDINIDGASFNLKAVLYVLCKPLEQDWSLVIFNEPKFEREFLEVNKFLRCLLEFKIENFSNDLVNLTVMESATESFQTVLSYLRFKLSYMSNVLMFMDSKISLSHDTF